MADSQIATEAESRPSSALPALETSNKLTEALTVLTLIREGLTVSEAGQRLGISRSTAFARLRLIEDDTERGVVKLLNAQALDYAEDWKRASKNAADKGDHRPAKDALLHAKAVEPVGDSQGRSGVTILIGTPEQPIRIQAPIIDLSPSESE